MLFGLHIEVAHKLVGMAPAALFEHATGISRKTHQRGRAHAVWMQRRGQEMADHRRFASATDIQAYFYDPQSPWQRGSNGNTNGLLRQYFPKSIDLSDFSQAKLDEVARSLN